MLYNLYAFDFTFGLKKPVNQLIAVSVAKASDSGVCCHWFESPLSLEPVVGKKRESTPHAIRGSGVHLV